MEVGGDGAVYVDPTDHAALAEAMFAILNDSDQEDGLRTRGQTRARMHTWDRSANAMADVYRQVSG